MVGGWSVNIPHGTDIYTPSLAADGITTLSPFRSGGAHGLDCGPTGGCTNSQVWPVPSEFDALLNTRPNPNAPWQLNKTVDYLPPRSLENASRTYQLLFGFNGALDAIDGTWDFRLLKPKQ